MFRYIAIVLATVACSTAKPSVVAPLSYSSPLFTGTSQVDIRNNYNSGYSTSLGYSSPLATRAAASISSPFSYTSGIGKYAAQGISTPYGYTAPVARLTPSLAAAAYVSPYAAPYASPYASAYASPYAASYAPFAAPYATAYGSPYAFAAPATAPVFL